MLSVSKAKASSKYFVVSLRLWENVILLHYFIISMEVKTVQIVVESTKDDELTLEENHAMSTASTGASRGTKETKQTVNYCMYRVRKERFTLFSPIFSTWSDNTRDLDSDETGFPKGWSRERH